MSFLLDTCVLSELAKPRPHPNVVGWFAGEASDDLFVSVVSVGEIESGIAKLPAGRKKAGLAAWLGRLRAGYADRLLGVDVEIAAVWGRMTARVEAAGAHLAVLDGLVAATASHHGYTVVTRNVKDFVATGVAIHDPW